MIFSSQHQTDISCVNCLFVFLLYVACQKKKKEDFLKNLHILSCFVQLKSVLFNLLCFGSHVTHVWCFHPHLIIHQTAVGLRAPMRKTQYSQQIEGVKGNPPPKKKKKFFLNPGLKWCTLAWNLACWKLFFFTGFYLQLSELQILKIYKQKCSFILCWSLWFHP